MITYKQSGVDVQAGDDLVEQIIPMAEKTHIPGVMGNIGGFAALFDLPRFLETRSKIRYPILVTGTDGVGTKIKLAVRFSKHSTIGIDLVAMCVNDVITVGAIPLMFLDYYASSKLDVNTAASVVQGIASGCSQAGCALVGGETAELPGMYKEKDYDLAGFAIGVADKDNLITGKDIKDGDIIIGLASTGFHSNGFSLINKCIGSSFVALFEKLDNVAIIDRLLEPTRIYAELIQHLSLVANTTGKINGMAHITGGGLPGNIPRVIPHNLTAVVKTDKWKKPVIFDWFQDKYKIDDNEMITTFNQGIGYVLIVDPNCAENVIHSANGASVKAWDIGYIRNRDKNEQQIILV